MPAAVLGLRTVDEHPAAVDSIGKDRRVLVLRMSHDAVALDRLEVLGRREKDARPAGP